MTSVCTPDISALNKMPWSSLFLVCTGSQSGFFPNVLEKECSGTAAPSPRVIVWERGWSALCTPRSSEIVPP